MKDPYKIFGISDIATDEEIQKAFLASLGDSKQVNGEWEAVFDINGVMPNIERWEAVFEAYNNIKKIRERDRKKREFAEKLNKNIENVPNGVSEPKYLLAFFSFQGRMGRKRYFFMFLIIFIPALIVTVINIPVVSFVFYIIVIQFQACNIVRRFHDLNKSGLHYWLGFIPLYNIYLMVVLFTRKGTAGDNLYGRDPLI